MLLVGDALVSARSLIDDALSQRLCQLLPDRAEDCTQAWLSSAHCHAGGGAPLTLKEL